jgi:hypothetical protein
LKLKCLVIAVGAFAVLSAAALNASSTPSDATQELRKAQATLKLSEQTRDRIAEEAAALKASGKASPELMAAYEVYLSRVQEIVVEHQKLVAQMEAALNAHQKRSPAEAASAGTGKAPSPDAGTEPVDHLKELERQFNESLAAFDEMLLKELKLIQAASAKRLQGLTEAAAEAGRQAGEKGGGASSEGKEATDQTARSGSQRTDSDEGRSGTGQAKTSGGTGKPGETDGASQPTGGWGSGGSGAPPGGYTPSPDDDIVARQLREAAEKETDPELKAKLWKEYEDYKKSRSKP